MIFGGGTLCRVTTVTRRITRGNVRWTGRVGAFCLLLFDIVGKLTESLRRRVNLQFHFHYIGKESFIPTPLFAALAVFVSALLQSSWECGVQLWP